MKKSSTIALATLARVASTPFEAQLRALGIEPIAEAEIKRYKQEQVVKYPPNMLGRILHVTGVPISALYPLQAASFVLALILAAVVVIIVGSDLSFVIPATTFLGSLLCLGLSQGVAYARRPHTVIVFPAKWKRVPWEANRAPAQVLERQKTVKHIRGIRFAVDELWQGSTQLDPILYAIDPDTGTHHAIAIWDDGVKETYQILQWGF